MPQSYPIQKAEHDGQSQLRHGSFSAICDATHFVSSTANKLLTSLPVTQSINPTNDQMVIKQTSLENLFVEFYRKAYLTPRGQYCPRTIQKALSYSFYIHTLLLITLQEKRLLCQIKIVILHNQLKTFL